MINVLKTNRKSKYPLLSGLSTLAIATCATLATAQPASAPTTTGSDAAELNAMLETMPRDSTLYGFIDIASIQRLLLETENIDQLTHNLRDTLANQSNAADIALAEIMENQIKDQSLRWMVLGFKVPTNTSIAPPDVTNVRFSGDFSPEDIVSAIQAQDDSTQLVGEMLKVSDGNWLRFFGDSILGMGSSQDSFSISTDAPSGIAAIHTAAISSNPPLFSIVVSLQELADTMPPDTPPAVKTIQATSFTFDFNQDGQFVADVRAQFDDEAAFNEAYAMANQYWQMAPMLLMGQKQQLMAGDPNDPEIAEALRSFNILEQSVNQATLTQEPPNIRLSIPIQATRKEVGDTLVKILIDGSKNFKEARAASAFNAGEPYGEPEPTVIMDLG